MMGALPARASRGVSNLKTTRLFAVTAMVTTGALFSLSWGPAQENAVAPLAKVLRGIQNANPATAYAKPVSVPAKVVLPEKVTSVEGITEYKLANGLRVLLNPDQSKPTVTVNITYMVGS